jgi:hypothetical protein
MARTVAINGTVTPTRVTALITMVLGEKVSGTTCCVLICDAHNHHGGARTLDEGSLNAG